MKCEECGGTGKVQKWFYERTGFGKYEKVCGDVKCEWCNGTGEVEQTEQEYIQTCNTEQLAEFLADKCNEVVETVLSDASCDIGDIDNDDYWYRRADFVEWLKQPHTKE
jgi:hypothetical protein